MSFARQIARNAAKQRWKDYRDLYREVQEMARARGAEMPVPLLPKGKKARKEGLGS